MKQRIIGFDIARAMAILGMVIVNFKLAMQAETGNQFLLWGANLFEGRASALFVVLAGVGVTFLTKKYRESQDNRSILDGRVSLIKRGFLLIAIGLAYTSIWEADILHFYGIYFLISVFLLNIKSKQLLMITALITALFPVLMIFFDYEKGWDWSTLTYEELWTIEGMIRHSLFNGFHPVFPWCALFLFGIWLGRQDLSLAIIRKKLLIGSLSVFALTELMFFSIRMSIENTGRASFTSEEIRFFLSISPIPPMPQYIIASGSLASVIIVGCSYLSERFTQHRATIWLCQIGQLSLT